MQLKNDITKVITRSKLAPRREPYWLQSGDAYLGFRCSGPNGKGTWVGRIREDGKQHYQALGRFEDYRDAAKALQEWLELRENSAKAGINLKHVRDLTVADACASYLEQIKRTKGSGKPYNYPKNILEVRVLGRERGKRKPAITPHPISKIKLGDLHQRHIKQWKADLLPCDEALAARAKRATAARQFKTLIAALNHAYRELMVASNSSWATVKNFGDVQARSEESHRYLTPEERRKLISFCADEVRDFIELMALTGARPIELQRLTTGDYNKTTGELSLWSYKSNKREKRIRRIPTAALPGVLPIIKRLIKNKLPKAFLFEQRTEFWVRHVKEAVRAAGLPDDVSAYSLRHSFITDAVGAGIPLATLAGVTGTSALQIERTYGKLLSSHVEEAFAKMAMA